MLEPPTTPCCEVVRCKGLCWNDFSHLSASRLAWMVAGFFFRSPDGRMILKYVWGLVLCWCSMFTMFMGPSPKWFKYFTSESDR